MRTECYVGVSTYAGWKERSWTVSGTCDTDRCKEQVISFAVSCVCVLDAPTTSERGLGGMENGRGRVDMDEMGSDRAQPRKGGSGTVQFNSCR
ncbi:hypothetical protein TMatcc_001827 [Talaromyces marneffei ATCC 18224]